MDMDHDEQTFSSPKKMNASLVIVGAAALLVVGVFAWRSMTGKIGPTPSASTAPVESIVPSSESLEEEAPALTEEELGAPDSVKTFEIEAGSYYYKPNEIRVKKGDTVRIVLKSVSMMHDFVIDELNVKMPFIKSGNTGEVEFVANTVGEFEFYCSMGNHREMGQTGSLIVEE